MFISYNLSQALLTAGRKFEPARTDSDITVDSEQFISVRVVLPAPWTVCHSVLVHEPGGESLRIEQHSQLNCAFGTGASLLEYESSSHSCSCVCNVYYSVKECIRRRTSSCCTSMWRSSWRGLAAWRYRRKSRRGDQQNKAWWPLSELGEWQGVCNCVYHPTNWLTRHFHTRQIR